MSDSKYLDEKGKEFRGVRLVDVPVEIRNRFLWKFHAPWEKGRVAEILAVSRRWSDVEGGYRLVVTLDVDLKRRPALAPPERVADLDITTKQGLGIVELLQEAHGAVAKWLRRSNDCMIERFPVSLELPLGGGGHGYVAALLRAHFEKAGEVITAAVAEPPSREVTSQDSFIYEREGAEGARELVLEFASGTKVLLGNTDPPIIKVIEDGFEVWSYQEDGGRPPVLRGAADSRDVALELFREALAERPALGAVLMLEATAGGSKVVAWAGHAACVSRLAKEVKK